MPPKLATCILSSELPLDSLRCGIAGELPLVDFAPQCLPVREAVIQALLVEDAISISAMFSQLACLGVE